MQHILVTGGTGTLGRHVISQLHNTSYKVRVLSRSDHTDGEGIEYMIGDLATGEGVKAAVEEYEIHHALRRQQQGRRGEDPEPGSGSIGDRCAASGLHLGRRCRPGSSQKLHRPRHVRLLRVQVGRRAHCDQFSAYPGQSCGPPSSTTRSLRSHGLW